MNPDLSIYLKVLNEAVAADGPAITALLSARVPCNEALAAHPTIQVREIVNESRFEVGALGLINGLIEAATLGGRIAAQYDDDDKLIGFVEYDVARWDALS